MNLIHNLLSGKITFAIRVGGHIKKIRAWTTRRAIMFLSARESPRPSQPLDSCPLLIPRPLRTEKYPRNIPYLQESFGTKYSAGYSPVSPKSNRVAIWKTSHRASGYYGCSLHTIFFRHDARHPGAWHPFVRGRRLLVKYWPFNVKEDMLALYFYLSFPGRSISKIRVSHGKKWDFVTDRSSRRMQKIAGVWNIIPKPRFFPRFIPTWDITVILLSLHCARLSVKYVAAILPTTFH